MKFSRQMQNDVLMMKIGQNCHWRYNSNMVALKIGSSNISAID